MTIAIEPQPVPAKGLPGFTLLLVGKVPLVLPADLQLNPRQTFAVELACWHVGRGDIDGATAVLHGLQRDVGVSPDAHVRGVEIAAAFAAARPGLARRQAASAERKRARLLNIPLADVPFSQAVQNALDLAEKALARAETARKQARRTRSRQDWQRVRDAQADVRKYEDRAAAARTEQLDARWVSLANRETTALAQGRGEDVGDIALPDLGIVAQFIRSRDGLAALYRRGRITEAQLRAGLAYRICYEVNRQGLRPAALGRIKVDGGKADRDGAAVQRIYQQVRLRQFEAGLNGKQLGLLEAVAGEGYALSSVVKGGNAYEAAQDALTAALAHVADKLAGRD